MDTQIDWEKRKKGDIGNDCLVSVDCTDCPIEEPHPFETNWSKRWYSHKFKGAALRYEVAISIVGGDVVWVNGPFPPGLFNDVDIFKQGLATFLERNERVEADGGYVGADPTYVKSKYGLTHSFSGRDKRSEVRARHETVNSRFKFWNSLSTKSRHSILKHGSIFRAVACITQIAFESGEGLFAIDDYSDKKFLEWDMLTDVTFE